MAKLAPQFSAAALRYGLKQLRLSDFKLPPLRNEPMTRAVGVSVSSALFKQILDRADD